MPLTSNNCEVAYFNTSLVNYVGDTDILRLTAKVGDETSSFWIEPPKLPVATPIGDVRFRNFGVFRYNERLPTVSLKTALEMLFVLLQKSPKPVLLVSHSPVFDSMLLFQAFQKTGLLNLFGTVVAGFSDTFPIFRKKMPNRKMLEDLSLFELGKDLLGKERPQPLHESTYYVDCLEELVRRFISKHDLVKNSTSYGRMIASGGVVANTFKLYQDLEPVANAIFERDPGPSSSTSNKTFQQKLISEMSSTTKNFEVAYFNTSLIGDLSDTNILRLTAKVGDETSSFWIKPPKPPVATQIGKFQFQGSQVYRYNERLPTVSLKTALEMLLVLLQKSPKPVLLVSHSPALLVSHVPVSDSTLMFQAFQKTGMLNLFETVVAGFSDTFSIFIKKIPNRKMPEDFLLPALAKDLLGIEWLQTLLEETRYLDCLEELVRTFISKDDLVENGIFYEKLIATGEEVANIFQKGVELVADATSERNLRQAGNPGPSSSTSSEAFQQNPDYNRFDPFTDEDEELLAEIALSMQEDGPVRHISDYEIPVNQNFNYQY